MTQPGEDVFAQAGDVVMGVCEQGDVRRRDEPFHAFGGGRGVDEGITRAHDKGCRWMQRSQALVADAGNAQRTWPDLGTDQCQQVEQRLRTCRCTQWRGAHDRTAQALTPPSAKQQQWERLEQECTLAPDTRGADQDQCVNPGRPSQRVIHCEETAERQAHECCAFHAECVEDIIQPLRMRIAVQRRLRAFAETRFANDVDGMHAVVLAPTCGIEGLDARIAQHGMRTLVTGSYAGWAPNLRRVLEACADFVRRPIYSLPADFRWTPRDGVTLVGDAAHLMPPVGVGVNLAMLDASDVAMALCAQPDAISALREAEALVCERARALMPDAIEGFQRWFITDEAADGGC